MTAALRTELWKRFREGLSFKQISHGVGLSIPAVWRHIAKAGGFAPRVCKRRLGALTESEREEISRGVAAGYSIRAIARALERAPSTISRELARNGGLVGYRAAAAERAAWSRGRRPQPCKLASERRLQRAVAQKLRDLWSPQQVSAWLRRNFPDDARMHVSHETIYKALFVQARGAFRDELRRYLRSHRMYRRPNARAASAGRVAFDGISISQRPAEADDRAVPGHWEGDLLMGTIDTCIATLVERSTRYVLLVKVASKEAKVVAAALAKAVKKLPAELRKSLTWDRGAEMRRHKEFTIATDIAVYFCDPHKPWQRGSNENTNGLLRQYFPHGTDFSQVPQSELNRAAKSLNGRPRETLGWKSPSEVLSEVLR